MRKYYLIADNTAGGSIEIRVDDSDKRGQVLLEIEADSFADACKKVRFSLPYNGKTGTMQIAGGRIVADVI